MMRRWLILLWLALLLIPAAGLFGAHERSSAQENRVLAQPPALPSTLEAWLELPRATDAFVRDQFGLRAKMIRANNRIRKSLGETSPVTQVVVGREGFLLLREGLSISFGQEVNPDQVARTATLVCEMRRRLAARNVRFVYTVAPATTTIYPEAAPEWLGEPQAPMNYDLLMREVRACGVNTLDLRPVLLAEKAQHRVYRLTDTHWSQRGALTAFNAIVTELDRPDLYLDPAHLQWRVREFTEGDLTRMSGAVDVPPEAVEIIVFPSTQPVSQVMLPTPNSLANMQSYVRDYGREGASVLIIGDSFAAGFFPSYLAQTARRVSFTHHRRCEFDWSIVDRAAPDVVIFMPTERAATCPLRAWPQTFPRENAQ
ncbi:MAG: hypothetical protein NW206_19245 [Hyphomonadaceae bacterium]|nr:hypothetical protein [Hyphomonadaceae bacterium]